MTKYKAYSSALKELNNYNEQAASIGFVNWWIIKYEDLSRQAIVELSNSCCGNKPCISMVEDCEFKAIHIFKVCFNYLDKLTEFHKFEEYFKNELFHFKEISGNKMMTNKWLEKSKSIVDENFILFFINYLEYSENPNHLKTDFREDGVLDFYVNRADFSHTIEFLELFNKLKWVEGEAPFT